MTNLRAELRRQWRQDNLDRKRQGLPILPWSEWGLGFKSLSEVDPELAASAEHLRVGGRSGGKSARTQAAKEAGYVDAATLPKPELGTAAASQMLTHDPDAGGEFTEFDPVEALAKLDEGES